MSGAQGGPAACIVLRTDPDDGEARALMDELSDALAAITGDSGRASFDPADVRAARACFAVARDAGGRALGCGAFRPLADGVAELKRMYARPGTRGVGGAVLRFLEAEAARLGFAELWLETRRVNARAVAFYERHGYAPIPNYGKYAGNPGAACFAKRLVP
jgi:GNAT superfamily N-acetyltransferase